MPKVVKQVAKPKRRLKKAGPRSAWDLTDCVRMNLYGRSGTGKTTLWSTFPGPILALICSGGIRPGELLSIDSPENRKKIRPYIIDRLEQLDNLVAEVKESEEYATVVLDHASALQDLSLKEVLGLEETPVQMTWGMATQSQYGQVGIQMKERLRALLSLPCHVVIVAQEREFNVDSDNSLLMPFVASALTPSIVGWLNPAVDYICQTFIRQKTREQTVVVNKKKIKRQVAVKGVDYCLRTAPDPTFTTKFRLPKGTVLPDVIVDPSFEKIQALIQGGR